jgi:hypothetical protein
MRLRAVGDLRVARGAKRSEHGSDRQAVIGRDRAAWHKSQIVRVHYNLPESMNDLSQPHCRFL